MGSEIIRLDKRHHGAPMLTKVYGHIGDSVRRKAMAALDTRKPTANTGTTDSAVVPQPQTIQ